MPFSCGVPGCVVANAGSVGLPYYGDRRASYLVVDEREVAVHRLDVEPKIRALRTHWHPQRDWITTILRTARFVPPPSGVTALVHPWAIW